MLGGGQITVDTSRPFSGQKALHVTGMMNSDKAYIQTPLAITATTIFVRFMMYTAGYPSSSGVHTRLLRIGTAAGTAAGTAENSYSLSSYNGTAIEKVNSIYLRDTGHTSTTRETRTVGSAGNSESTRPEERERLRRTFGWMVANFLCRSRAAPATV